MKYLGPIKALVEKGFSYNGNGFVKFGNNKEGNKVFLNIVFQTTCPVSCQNKIYFKMCGECPYDTTCHKTYYTYDNGIPEKHFKSIVEDIAEGFVSEDSTLNEELTEGILRYLQEN